MHACFFTPGPPNLGLSLQKMQVPQSSVRRQAGQSMQRTPLLRGGCPPLGVDALSARGVVFLEGHLGLCDWRTDSGGVLAGSGAETNRRWNFTSLSSFSASSCSPGEPLAPTSRPIPPSSFAPRSLRFVPLTLVPFFLSDISSLSKAPTAGSIKSISVKVADEIIYLKHTKTPRLCKRALFTSFFILSNL